ncbi:sugar ABC transporter permease (plasmid) [Vibrio pelagius]|uniref:Sugar ABC transporter permease n=1 Tax=Vibrio pelagius TaxID=28169 RepID=A0ABY5GC59_VIBPE|nr:sugar ABC transporter permease [Vibrio pelagius]UTT87224.1 sugar ABC transporter permease [Vibrio pelagius]
MRRSTFLAFIAPSIFMMVFFIAAPLVSVFWQSLHVTKPVFEEVKIEKCSPGFMEQICTTEITSRPTFDSEGKPIQVTEFVGLDSYREMLQPERVVAALTGEGESISSIFSIDFYKALRFTLTFTLITLPLVLGLGLALAIAVHNTVKSLRGPIIFISLLPFIITPVIGALSIRWLFVSDGILSAGINHLLGYEFAMFAQSWTIEILMMFYRVWHVAPFAFIIFYAGLQSVNQDTLDAAIVDGASRWERTRSVIIPHLMPLIIFVSMVHLMDAYRVFEEVIGFSSEAHVISLQWLTFDLLTPDNTGNRSISRASASSMLTLVGIVLLLIPVLQRTWRDHKRS